MHPVKIMCGVAVLLVAGAEVAGMSPERRAALASTIGVSTERTEGVASPRPGSTMPHVAAVPRPSPGIAAIDIPPDRFGQFESTVEIEGRQVPVMIDTGASFVCLTFEDADRLGIRPAPSDFSVGVRTANGGVAVAPTSLRSVRLGTITVRDVPALVAPRGALDRTLLGMSFLRQLGGFRVEAGHLLLQP